MRVFDDFDKTGARQENAEEEAENNESDESDEGSELEENKIFKELTSEIDEIISL